MPMCDTVDHTMYMPFVAVQFFGGTWSIFLSNETELILKSGKPQGL